MGGKAMYQSPTPDPRVEEVNNMGTKRWNPRIHNSLRYYGVLILLHFCGFEV